MAPHDLRRPFKRTISDQQRRREAALVRQGQHRSDAQNRARFLASSVLSFPADDHDLQKEPGAVASPAQEATTETSEVEMTMDEVVAEAPEDRDLNVVQAAKLRGAEARRWFARQLMLPEWMIDVPPHLDRDWFVFPRPSGKRCFVVSSNGSTISRLRNGSILHRFPSLLPNGAKSKDISGPASSYSILDCIFHESDQTYYVIDMVCWRGYSLYDCTTEFRLFWLTSKLAETGACNPPSKYHKFQFSAVPFYSCDLEGLHAAYSGVVQFAKDGMMFYNKHAHYQTGITPLALVWKDGFCSQYLLDTDSKGQIPCQQQVVLELQDDGKLTTSDEPPVVFGCLSAEFIQKSDIRAGNLLKFTIRDEGVRVVDGKLEMGDLQFQGKSNRARAFADSYSKVFFQYAARHSPVRIEDLAASISQNHADDNKIEDIDMT